MPAPRKYDQETRDRAVRMYQDRRRDFPVESAL
jgi:transposase